MGNIWEYMGIYGNIIVDNIVHGNIWLYYRKMMENADITIWPSNGAMWTSLVKLR